MENQRILKIINSIFPEDRFEFENLKQVNDEFEYIRLIRQHILEAWKNHPNRKDFLLRGIDAFQEMWQKNVADSWNILINEAYLHEYLDHQEKSNKCLVEAVEQALIEHDKTVGEKADRFFQHFTRKASYNNNYEEWHDLLKRQERIVGKFSEGSRLMISICQKYGNISSELTSRIITNPQEMLSSIEADLKQLLKLNQKQGPSFRINLRYLDQVIEASLVSVNNRTLIKKDLNKGDTLLLILYKVMISATGDNNPKSFRKYAKLVEKLFQRKKSGLDSLRKTRNFFNKKEKYLERAIDLGEQKLRSLQAKKKNTDRTLISLSKMYYIRGQLKKEEGAEKDAIWNFRKADEIIDVFVIDVQFLLKIKRKYGDNVTFTSQIVENPIAIFKSLKSDFERLLKMSKDLEYTSQIDLKKYLDQTIGDALKSAKGSFLNNELSNKYDLLILILTEIMISLNSSDDPDNFANYGDFVEYLHQGKKNGLNKEENAKKLYKKEEIYLKKAIELGEQKINSMPPRAKNIGRKYSLLADMYRIRGLKKKQEIEGDSISDFNRAVELFREGGDTIFDENHFDRNVERFAECLRLSKKYKSAIVQYKKLFEESETKKYQGALGLGRSYFEKKDLENAEYWYLEARKIDKSGPGAYDGMVHIRREQGRFTEAIKWRRKMLNLPEISMNSRNYWYYDIEELYREDGTEHSLKQALDVYKDIIENQKPDWHEIVYNKFGTALVELKGYEKAINDLQKKANSNNIKPKLRAFYFCKIGDCYAEINDIKEKDAYQKALIVNPKYVPAIHRMISWYQKNGKYDKAIENINELIFDIVDEENSDDLWKWKGDLKRDNEDYIGAFEAYEQCFSVNFYRFDAYHEIRRLLNKHEVKKKFDAKINNRINKFQNCPNPRLARKIVKLCLLSSSQEYAPIAEKYIKECNYEITSAEFILDKALIYEVKEEFGQAIKLREQLKPLGNIPFDFEWLKLNNIKKVIQDIDQKELYKRDVKYKKLMSLSLDKLVKFLEIKVTPDEEMIREDEIEKEIYHYRESIWFLAKHFHRRGHYTLALRWIKKLTHSDKPYLFTNKRYLFKEAQIFFSLGTARYSESVKILDKILNHENNRDAKAFFLKGKINRKTNDFPDAVISFDKALEIDKSENSGKVPATLDQIGLTYRCWIKQKDLTAEQRKRLKNEAIKNYQKIIDDFPDRFVERAYHGLAQSYLLKPVSDADIDEAGNSYFELLSNGLSTKNYITKEDVDRTCLFELLHLWQKVGNNTLKKILLNESTLLKDLSDHDRRFIRWKIIKVAKDENIFADDIFVTLEDVYNSSRNSNIKRHCCQYFMKYLIFTSYNGSILKLRQAIKNVVDILIGNNQYKKRFITDLAFFLGAERNAYLERLTKKLREDLEKISDHIFNLDKDNIHHEASKIGESLESVKTKAQNIGIQKVGSKDFVQIIQEKERTYQGRVGRQIELKLITPNSKDKINVPTNEQVIKEDKLFDCFDLIKMNNLKGNCTLSINSETIHKKPIVNLKLSSKLHGEPEKVSTFHNQVKEKLDTNTQLKFDTKPSKTAGNIRVDFELKLKLQRLINVDNPYEELLQYVTQNSFQEKNEIRKLKEVIEKYISGNEPRKVLKQKLSKYIYSQLELFSDNSKGKLMEVLDIPHTLKNLMEQRADISEYEIEQLQNKFKSLRFIAKDFKLPEEQESFSLLDVCKDRKDFFQGWNEDIHFTLNHDEDEMYLMVGEKENFKLLFSNILYNSVKSVKEKLNNKNSFVPAIDIHLSKNYAANQYKIRFADNGVGVEPGIKMKNHIEKSSGIGLPTIYSIIQKYEGNITIESAQTGKNSGITFSIAIPIPNEL